MENIERGSHKRSNLDDAANAFIRAYIDEVTRIKKKGTRKQKIAYLFRKKKDITINPKESPRVSTVG